MIFDALPFRNTLSASDTKNKALGTFIEYLEKKFDVQIVKDMRRAPLGRPDLGEALSLAGLLKRHGVVTEFGQAAQAPDDPPIKGWYAECADSNGHRAGGISWDTEENALRAALSEALERHLWLTQEDYFKNPTRATAEEIRSIGRSIDPHIISGFSDEQRMGHPHRQLRPNAQYLWIEGISLLDGGPTYVPAQIASGKRIFTKEPEIRHQLTTGLATWPTQTGARLAGTLEVIEREAYMIMWLNQLTLPRIALEPLYAQSPSLARAVALCEKYRFKTHAIQLLTDAPAYAVAVVLEDLSGNAPRFAVGLGADTSLPRVIKKAMLEAVRGHQVYRRWASGGNTWDTQTPLEKIGHKERVFYWGIPENAKHLEFMIQGPEIEVTAKPWDTDTIEEHFARIIQWCKDKNLDLISVPLTASAKNPTSLHVEVTIIPQAQSTYLYEWSQQFGSPRLQAIPTAFGYAPREKPFADRPHPFL